MKKTTNLTIVFLLIIVLFNALNASGATTKFVNFNVHYQNSSGCSLAPVTSMIFGLANRNVPFGGDIGFNANCNGNTMGIASGGQGYSFSMACRNYYLNHSQYLNYGFSCVDKDDSNVWAFSYLENCVTKKPLFTIFTELNVCTKDFFQGILAQSVTKSTKVTRVVNDPIGFDTITFSSYDFSGSCEDPATYTYDLEVPIGGNSSQCSEAAGSGASIVLGGATQIMTAGQYKQVYASASSIVVSFTVFVFTIVITMV